MSCNDQISACGCCEGLAPSTPRQRHPRPGLSRLDWRVGTHGRFFESMLSRISAKPSLGRLGTRRRDDFTIGLLDAWATTLDVLAFYQERLANEAYLRTAEERRSLLELANLIGYELGPGVSAQVLLAFVLDDAATSPREVAIAPGTRAQSLPVKKDEVPQSFETDAELVARPRWNVLHPRRKAPQEIDIDSRAFYFAGVATGLRRGDPLLLDVEGEQELLRVRRVEAQAEAGRTLVLCGDVDKPGHLVYGEHIVLGAQLFSAGISNQSWRLAAPFEAGGGFVSGGHLAAIARDRDWSDEDLIAHLGAYSDGDGDGDSDGDADTPSVHALRESVGIFGHNAPLYDTLPKGWVGGGGHFKGNWDQATGWPVDRSAVDDKTKHCLHLERVVDELVEGSWVVLENEGGARHFFRAARVAKESVADFSLSGKVTRLHLENVSLPLDDGQGFTHAKVGEKFKLRDTTVHAVSERLELIDLPIDDLPAKTSVLVLEEPVPDLLPGRRLILRGKRSDEPGVTSTEELTVKEVEHGKATVLTLVDGLGHSYENQTVEIFANVAVASHGETRGEILGGGDASVPFQSFTLKQSPLTHLASQQPGGAEPAFELRVDGVRWHRRRSLYGLAADDPAYILRRNDDGTTTVRFGDGVAGRRPPTGSENLAASYRVGVGEAGLVAADQVSLLATRPLGVKSVTNPAPSRDAQDPETRDQARQNAPLTVLTLDRVVSLRDFEDYARAFAGIAKARADRLWDGSRRVVHLSLAGTQGAVASNSLKTDLRESLDAARDTDQPIEIGDYQRLAFVVEARLKIDPDVLWDDVESAAGAALRAAFGFDVRELGRRLAESDVISVLQGVPGVVAVDLESLAEVKDTVAEDEMGLPAHPARFIEAPPGSGSIQPAQLVVLADSTADPIRLTQMP